jgi:hypothetical protein
MTNPLLVLGAGVSIIQILTLVGTLAAKVWN